MDGPCPRDAGTFCVYRRGPCCFRARPELSTSHPGKLGRSLGNEYIYIDPILFYMAGKYYFVHVLSVHPFPQDRALTTSSTVIAKIGPEIVLSNGVSHYQVLRTQDIIGPSEFASTVEPEMVFEISIILRQKLPSFLENRKTCPRCRHINLKDIADNSWIEWKVPGYFYPC